MSERKQTGNEGNEASGSLSESSKPRCLEIAKSGIATGSQFAGFMSALMSDLIEGTISPQVGQAAVNAGGKLLKVVEMQYKHGRPTQGSAEKPRDLELCPRLSHGISD